MRTLLNFISKNTLTKRIGRMQVKNLSHKC